MYLVRAEVASHATRSVNTVASVPPVAGSTIEYPRARWIVSDFSFVFFSLRLSFSGAGVMRTTSSPVPSGSVQMAWEARRAPFEQSTQDAVTSAWRTMASEGEVTRVERAQDGVGGLYRLPAIGSRVTASVEHP